MSENELTIQKDEEVLDLTTLASENKAVSKYGDEVFDGLGASGWLPRIQLMVSTSAAVKKPVTQGGGFPVNHYALVKGKTNHDIGEAVDILSVAWRPKALDMNDDIVTIYDPEDSEFKRIQTQSNEKDSGCMWGYEFLCWIGDLGEWATFFMASKTARNEAPSLKGLINKLATLRSHYIETAKFSWQAPQVVACSTPLKIMPTRGALVEQLEKFNNPAVQKVERAQADSREV